MKRAFITGLIILLPIAITVYIVLWIVDLFTEPFSRFVEPLFFQHPGNVPPLIVAIVSRLVILLILACVILLLGFLTRRFFFHQFVLFSEKLIAKIPIIKTIYTIASEATKAVLRPGQKAFQRTVLLSFPLPHTSTLGLVTGKPPAELQGLLSKEHLTVFVPTAPHPISGYLLFVAEKDLIPVPMTTEETFAFLISCGTASAQPNEESS
jgi:uncharacterized membrane protein